MKDQENVSVLDLEETSRTYFFPNGGEFTIHNAVQCLINQKNTHQLVTKQGEIYIVPYKWIAMKYVPVVKDKKSKK